MPQKGPMNLNLRRYSQYENRNINVGHASLFQIPDELLEVGNTCGHIIGKGFDGDDLNANVNQVQIVEDHHLGADVVDHEGVLAELHLNTQSVLDEINLAECAL